MATASFDNSVKIWDPTNNTWTLKLTYTRHTSEINALEYLNADTILSAGYDKTIQMWSISTGIQIRTINVGTSVISLKLLFNGYCLASGLFFGNINVYNIND